MRRKDKEIFDKRIIDEILSQSEVCRIAMLDGDKPYLIPLNYGYRDNTLYFHSAPSGKKIDLLRKNNFVCFEIEHAASVITKDLPCDWSARYRSVIGYGMMEIIADKEKKKEGLDVIMAHYGKKGKNIYSEKQIEKLVVLKLSIEQISGKQSGDWDQSLYVQC